MPDTPKYRILVCPLDWGLGHATRCIPLIRELQKNGAEVVLAADGPQLELLRTEFPKMEWVSFPGYRIRYGLKYGAWLSILINSPRLIFNIFREHLRLRSLIRKHNINGLISDNRYGLWNRRIRTVFITHQMNIIAPAPLRFSEPLLRAFTRIVAGRFDECWIPDQAGDENLSGRLSHGCPLPGNARFIGILSRFDLETEPDEVLHYEVLAVVSGPEPQRTVFEEELLARLPLKGRKCLLLRGIPGDTAIINLRENLDVAGHLPASLFHKILMQNPFVICRSGYSTLMDLAVTGNQALLVPTPGQTEQEYLAGYLETKGVYLSGSQHSFDPERAIGSAAQNTAGHSNVMIPCYQAFVTGFLRQISNPGSYNG